MIIWLNGAFGSGKTQTAFEINRRLENSFVYDPENIGYFFRRNMPKEIIQGNFQDQILWRTFNYEIIKNIYAKYSGTIIIPMTIYNKDYFEEIVGKLLKDSIEIDHYILGANKETIIKRLSSRFDGKNSWAANQIDICINGFKDLMDKTIYIETDKINIYEVVKIIAEKSNLILLKDNDIEIVKKIKRKIVQIKHIKLFV
jgi:hypothetical protein